MVFTLALPFSALCIQIGCVATQRLSLSKLSKLTTLMKLTKLMKLTTCHSQRWPLIGTSLH